MPWEDEERRLGDRLIRLYEQAEREIVAHIQRMTASGADPAKTISQLSRQRRQVEGILAQLRKQSASWAEKAVKASYNSGVDAAQEQLAAEGVVLADFGAIHQAAVSVYAEKTYSRLADVCSVAGRTTMDIYRAASLEASMLGAVAGYETWQQARRKILDEVTEKGIVGFVDRAGKRWSMKTYAEMLSRTVLMEIHNEAQWREFRAHGEDLIAISFHTGTCPKCAPWQGRVLSLTGQTPGFPTLDDAKAGGLFHPRCRHAAALFVPDEGETPEETERKMAAHRKDVEEREDWQRRAKEAGDREELLAKRWTINPAKQARHIPGTKEYEEYAEKLKGKGQKPSILTLPARELQKILIEREGEWERAPGAERSREKWEVRLNRSAGLWYDKSGKGPMESNLLIVVPSNTGTHVYPGNPHREGQKR